MPAIAIGGNTPVSSLLLRQSVNADGSLVPSPLIEAEITRQLDPNQQGLMVDVPLSERDLRLIVIGMIEAREVAAKVADKWYGRGSTACRQVAEEIRKG